jgi:hypothetical protein
MTLFDILLSSLCKLFSREQALMYKCLFLETHFSIKTFSLLERVEGGALKEGLKPRNCFWIFDHYLKRDAP